MRFLRLKINQSAQPCKNNLQYCLTRFFVMAYRLPAPHKTGAGFSSLIVRAGSRCISVTRFFCARNTTIPRIMAGRDREAVRPAGFSYASLLTLLRPATMFSSVLARLRKSVRGAAKMATTTPTLAYTQNAFIWRFIAFGASERQIIHVTAWTEREARNRCPSGCIAVFAARIRQGVAHV